MPRAAFLVMLLSVVGGYFGLGAIDWTPVSALAALIGVFVAALLISFLYESLSRRRWVI